MQGVFVPILRSVLWHDLLLRRIFRILIDKRSRAYRTGIIVMRHSC